MEREGKPNNLVFFNLPAAGHVNPSLPLIAELTRRGNRVLYYTGDQFRTQIERQGAEFRSYGAHLSYDHSRLPTNLLRIAAVLARATEDLLPFALSELRRERPAVVVSDSMCPWGRLAARARETPAVASLTALPIDPGLLREHTSALQYLLTASRGAPGYIRFLAARRRLRRAHGVDLGGLFDMFVFRDRLTLVYTSRAFQPHSERFDESVRFVGPMLRSTEEPDDELMSGLDGPPPVYVSMGTVQSPGSSFFRACIDAFAGADYKLVLSVGRNFERDSLGPVPPNCLVRQSVPQLAVLRRARLFITHAGMNSVNEALALGVPLLLYPQSVEQAIIAARVQELGAGRTISGRDVTPEGIRATADELLSGSYRDAARSLGRSFEQAGGAPAAADAVEELIASPTA